RNCGVSPADRDQAVREIVRLARPAASDHDFDVLAAELAGPRVVMLGEASHGTSEFYSTRFRISQRLIAEHEYRFIGVEGDWPECKKIDDYVCGRDVEGVERDNDDPRDVLATFDRWPTWMWANAEVAELMAWMREFNAGRPIDQQARFHGLDIYSLYKSIDAVLRFLEDYDPDLAREAAERYACFEPYDRDEISFARSTMQLPQGCSDEAVAIMLELLSLHTDATGEGQSLFDAQQNARVVRNAERYYRTMLRGDASSWNIRDRHMLETLDRLLQTGASADGAHPKRGIVWAHNTHIGDYRATDMAGAGYVNLGGLARESYGRHNVELVGLSTYQGTVIAARAWDARAERMPVPRARPDSYEATFHVAGELVGKDDFVMKFDDAARNGPFAEVTGHRAIGVVFDPDREAHNYVPTLLAERYDDVAFIHDTEALQPVPTAIDPHEVPLTWPTGV
ncbi:MAG TPA: erythromycin esterase family protein, partial [Solirubrobacterales bacterium]|nr:erythromycin esterase family protein [Solirubrobacterales bacterium]